ncbi:hypothetical protein [Streptomyces mirabilis]|uniref:hypothetical protein n=1 Tax=Streptomyces mirabilis TaxID=68239 RepID=UPI00331D248D
MGLKPKKSWACLVADLGGAALLARAGVGRGLGEGELGFSLGKAACGDEAAEGVGGAVERVGEPCAFGDAAAGLDGGEDGSEHALDAAAAAAACGEHSLLGAGRDRSGRRAAGGKRRAAGWAV